METEQPDSAAASGRCSRVAGDGCRRLAAAVPGQHAAGLAVRVRQHGRPSSAAAAWNVAVQRKSVAGAAATATATGARLYQSLIKA